MLETLKIRSQTHANKDHSSMISIPVPLNFINLLGIPCLLGSMANRYRLNGKILRFVYFFVLLGTGLVFMVYTLLIIPVCYVKMWFHKFTMIFVYSKSYRKARSDKFISAIFFTGVGLLTLTANFLLDLIAFVRHSFVKDINKIKHSTSNERITQDRLEVLLKFLRTKDEKILPYEVVAKEMRNQMQLMDLIVDVLRPQNKFASPAKLHRDKTAKDLKEVSEAIQS